MAESQGATPPAWLGRSRWRLLADVIGGAAPELGQAAPARGADRRVLPPGAGAPAAGAAARARPRRRDADDRAAAGGGARSDDGERRRGDQALLSQPGDPVGVPQPAAVHLRARRRCWIRSGCSRRATRSSTTCCRRFTAIPLYDLVLLRAHEGGVEAMAAQARADPRRHAPAPARADVADRGRRVPRRACRATSPRSPPTRTSRRGRSPPGWSTSPHLMLAMDQFKDVGGFAATPRACTSAWRGRREPVAARSRPGWGESWDRDASARL